MKKILFGLAALSAMAFGEGATVPTASTGVHTATGSNQIDVETRAYIINSGLVITATAGTEGDTISNAIKKAILDHGTLMAGTNPDSTESKDVFIRRANGGNFPAGTVVNIALNTDGTNKNNLVNGVNTIAHTLDANVSEATYSAGSGTNGGQTLSLSDDKEKSNGDFKVLTAIHNIKVALTSTIAANATSGKAEGQYTNTSTLAVRFSKIPHTVGSNDGEKSTLANYTPLGTPIKPTEETTTR